MSLSYHQATVPVFARGLRQLSHLLERALAHARDRGLDPDTLLGARLAEDMLPLSAQVQRASDTAKASVQRLSGVQAPVLEDNEASLDQLQARIQATLDYLESVPADTMEAERSISLKFGQLQAGFDSARYVTEFALPNFFFHVTTAYAILRNQGVGLGKLDYLGRVGQAQPG